MRSLRSRILWVLVNAAGIGTFLGVASMFWVEPELADIPGAGVGNFVGWGISALPIFVLFVLANIAWLAVSWTQQPRHRLAPTVLAGAFLLCWLGAFWLDGVHHGI